MTSNARSIAIIGAGFSGTSMAMQLLRRASARDRILLFEKSPHLGRGVAYGTSDPRHLLNIRAGRMGAFDEDPQGFLTWLNGPGSGDIEPLQRPVSPEAFVPRRFYGRYLQHCLQEALPPPENEQQFQRVSGEVVDIIPAVNCLLVKLQHGALFAVDRAILALGNQAPDRNRLPHYVGDPWNEDALHDLDAAADVLIIGTSLTMVDTVLSLLAKGHLGRIYAVSRRGLLPQTHSVEGRQARWPLMMPLPNTCLGLLRLARSAAGQAASAGRPWEEVIEAFRPHIQTIWHDLPVAERKRFLRHLRPWWEMHRHRIPFEAAAKVAEAIRSGQLRVMAGRIEDQNPCDEGVEVRIRGRGDTKSEWLRVARIINCSGPKTDYAAGESDLLRNLVARGDARPDPLALGLDVAPNCAVLNANGRPSDRLYAVGPLTRGVHWEITAVPEIRRQCADLADQLSGTANARAGPADPTESSKLSSQPAGPAGSPFQKSA